MGFSAPGVQVEDVQPLFAPFGALDNVRVLSDKNCAFVTFVDKVDAWKAVQHMQANPGIVLGLPIRVGWGKAPLSNSSSQSHASGPSLAPPSNNIWVGGIPYDITDEDLRTPFSRFGRIENIKLLPAKKCAFVTYPSSVEAGNAIRELQGYEIRGERIRLNYGHAQFSAMKARMEAEQEGRAVPVPQVDPPDNADLVNVIESLASFVDRLGVSFEEMVKDEQKSNPRFEFLFGGTGKDYYDWKKYELSQRESASASSSSAAPWSKFGGASGSGGGGGSAAPWSALGAGHGSSGSRPGDGNIPDPNAVTLSQPEIARLSSMLERLVPTQESIKEAKDWVMARGKLASDIVSFVKAKIAEIHEFSQRLHILYLVNDVLLHSSLARQEGAPDYYGPAFQRQLYDICAVVVEDYDATPDQKQKVIDLVGIWISKGFYAREFLENMKEKLETIKTSGAGALKRQKL